MNPPGRPEGECRSEKHEGSPVSIGRPLTAHQAAAVVTDRIEQFGLGALPSVSVTELADGSWSVRWKPSSAPLPRWISRHGPRGWKRTWGRSTPKAWTPPRGRCSRTRSGRGSHACRSREPGARDRGRDPRRQIPDSGTHCAGAFPPAGLGTFAYFEHARSGLMMPIARMSSAMLAFRGLALRRFAVSAVRLAAPAGGQS